MIDDRPTHTKNYSSTLFILCYVFSYTNSIFKEERIVQEGEAEETLSLCSNSDAGIKDVAKIEDEKEEQIIGRGK